MADRDKLSQMLDAIINKKPEDAQIAFHGYLSDRIKEEIHGSEEGPDNNEDE